MQNASRYLRQLDLAPTEKLARPITVVGAGALGSAAVMALAKLGCSQIKVFDPDQVSDHNLPSQFLPAIDYNPDYSGGKGSMVGLNKSYALKCLVRDLGAEDIDARCVAFDEDTSPERGIVIVATDSMASRKLVWDKHKDRIAVECFIDARMGAQVLRLFTIIPSKQTHRDFYSSTLYTSEEAEHQPCSAKAIVFCPMVAGGLIARQVKRICMEEAVSTEIFLDMSVSPMRFFENVMS